MELIKRMTAPEAKTCIASINSNISNIRALILDLYERQGWAALGYGSWRECVVAEFKEQQRYLYYQLEAAKIGRNLCTIVQKTESIPEGQLRPLARLEPEKQKEAWQMAVDTAPNGKVTADHVYKIVKGMQEPREQKVPEPLSINKPAHAIYFATIAISQLERIADDDPTKEEALAMVEEWINKKRNGGRKYGR